MSSVVCIAVVGVLLMYLLVPRRLRLFLRGGFLFVILLISLDVSQFYFRGTTFIPSIESIACLLSLPNDYFLPLGEIALKPDQLVYELECCHKYRGQYVVALSMPRLSLGIGEVKEIPFRATTKIFSPKGKDVYVEKSDLRDYAWTMNEFQTYCLIYSVPEICKRNEKVRVQVVFDGAEFGEFVKKNSGIRLVVSKRSDK